MCWMSNLLHAFKMILVSKNVSCFSKETRFRCFRNELYASMLSYATPSFRISTSTVDKAQPPVAVHQWPLSHSLCCTLVFKAWWHTYKQAVPYFLQILNDHGGWCRHTAKWWNSCLGVWGPADHPCPGKSYHHFKCTFFFFFCKKAFTSTLWKEE